MEGYDLDKCSPAAILKLRKEKKEAEGQKAITSFKDLKDLSNEIMFSYNDLKSMLSEHEHWRKVIIDFRDNVLSEPEAEGRKLTPFVVLS